METKQPSRPPGQRDVLVLKRPWVELAGECALRFLLSAILSAGEILGGYSPLALGYLSAAGAGAGGFFSVLGCGVGYLLSKPLPDGFRYLATAILIYAVSFAFFDLRIYLTRYFMPLSAAGMAALTGFIYLAEQGWTGVGLICYLTELLVIFCSGRLFAVPHRGEEDPLLLSLSYLTLAGGILLALQRVPLPYGLQLGSILGCAGALWCSAALPHPAGIGASLGLGLFLDLAQEGGCVYTAALGTAGLLAARPQKGRKLRVLSFLLGAGCLSLWSFPLTESLTPLGNALLGCLLYLTLPSSLMDRLEGNVPKHLQGKPVSLRTAPPAADTAPPGLLQQKLRGQADAFHRLYEQLSDELSAEPLPRIDPFPLYLRASQRVCRGCAFSSACWKRDKAAAQTLLRPAMEALQRRGRSDPADYPPEFSARCARINELVNEVNDQYASARTRQRYRLRLRESRSRQCRQYEGMGHLLGECAQALEPKSVPAMSPHALTALAGVAAGKKPGQNVSGDAGGWFKDGEDKLWVVLCDGMGTGSDAAKDSRFAYHLLEQFLSAGISPEVALSTAANALSLRWECTGSFTTIDLLELDLGSGEGCLYKFGAAPTYLRRSGVVSRISSSTLPAGLHSGSPPDISRFRLRPGDLAVLVSDGVTDGSGDDPIREAVRLWTGDSPRELAAQLLAFADPPSDDRTAIVLLIGTDGIKSV